MSKNAVLRALVTQRLTAAAEDILVLFERSIAEYEQEVLLLTHNNSSQQLRPSSGVQIVSLKEDSLQVVQLQEPDFVPVCVKAEDDVDTSSVLHPRPTEEKREETNESDCEAEAGCSSDPLTQLHPDILEHDDSSDHTDHSEDYSQVQAPAKRSYAMIPPNLCVTDRPFRCLDCGKSFKWKSNLRIHMLVHTEVKPFLCSVCEKGFLKKSDLTRHQTTVHHLCPVCAVRFKDRASFKEHLNTHAEDGTLDPSAAIFTEIGKPFICSKCGKRFRANSYLLRHMLVHTDERPHKCSDCDKCYKDISQLKKHFERCKKHFINNGERFHMCPVCGKGCISKPQLTRHQKLAHQIKKTDLKTQPGIHLEEGTMT